MRALDPGVFRPDDDDQLIARDRRTGEDLALYFTFEGTTSVFHFMDFVARVRLSEMLSAAAGKRMKHMGERQRCTSIATPLPFCALIISA